MKLAPEKYTHIHTHTQTCKAWPLSETTAVHWHPHPLSTSAPLSWFSYARVGCYDLHPAAPTTQQGQAGAKVIHKCLYLLKWYALMLFNVNTLLANFGPWLLKTINIINLEFLINNVMFLHVITLLEYHLQTEILQILLGQIANFLHKERSKEYGLAYTQPLWLTSSNQRQTS